MPSIRALLWRLGMLFRRRQLDRELEEELRFHFEMEEQENLRGGMSGADARHAARRNFGNLTQSKKPTVKPPASSGSILSGVISAMPPARFARAPALPP